MLATAAIGMAGCGANSAEPPFDVTVDTVSAEHTQEIRIWSPDADGPWPIVLGFHGMGGSPDDWDTLATELARRGVVVIVPAYRIDAPEVSQRDLVCGSRYGRMQASEYGGDHDQPVTVAGHSLGATLAFNTLDEATYGPDGTYEVCYEGQPAPAAIVAMNGCYVEDQGQPVTFDPAGLGSARPAVTLVAGDQDQTCPPQQAEQAATILTDAGFDTTMVTIPDGDHFTPIFGAIRGGEYVNLPTDDPGGQIAVEAILDAVDG